MSGKVHAPAKAAPTSSFTPAPTGLLQRKCACGGKPGLHGDCTECRQNRLTAQPNSTTASSARFGHDFGRVRVHEKDTPKRIQTKLTVNEPGDKFEREADRIADQVMRIPERRVNDQPAAFEQGHGPDIRRLRTESNQNLYGQLIEHEQLQRQPLAEEEKEEEELSIRGFNVLSLKGNPGAAPEMSFGVESQIQSLHGDGQPLRPDLRDFFEPRFGHDFKRVRIHTDARAAQTTRFLNARAYTLGTDIAFAPGEYRPSTWQGRELLSHELTHVVQQRGNVQAVMRVCNCSAMAGARAPTASEETGYAVHFPRLVSGDWCIIGPQSSTYNCFAWSVGNTTEFLDTEVDTDYGNNDGSLTFSDFDAFYSQKQGLTPVIGQSPLSPMVALFAKGGIPKHAALVDPRPCGFAFTSKLGPAHLILHDLSQLEGGAYGDVERYYVHQGP